MKPHPCSFNASHISSSARSPNLYYSNILGVPDGFGGSFFAFYDFLEVTTASHVNSTTADFWVDDGVSYSTPSSLGMLSSVDPTASSTTLAGSLKKLNTVAYFYITPIIIAFGIVGDILSVAVLSHPLLRKTSVVYSYLLALAVTDLLTLISVIPPILWIMKIKLCTLAAARYYAHVGFPLANAFMGASVYIVVFLTFNQYMAVCHPFVRSDFIRSRRFCLILTLVAYALSFALYVPWAWRKNVRYVANLHWTFESCPYEACDNLSVVDSFWYKTYQWTREVISRFTPFLLIAYFNLRMLYVYRRTRAQCMSAVSLREQKLTARQKTEREQRRLWALLFGIMTLFFVCTIPAAPFTIMVSDRLENNLTFQTIRAVTNVLEFTKFALNFYLYCMINPDIRRLCVKRLTCQSSINSFRAPMVGSRNSYHLSDLLQMSERRHSQRHWAQSSCQPQQKRSGGGTGGTASGTNHFSYCTRPRRTFSLRQDSERLLLPRAASRNVTYMANDTTPSLNDSQTSPNLATPAAQRSPAVDAGKQNGSVATGVRISDTDIVLHNESEDPSISWLSFSEMFNDEMSDYGLDCDKTSACDTRRTLTSNACRSNK